MRVMLLFFIAVLSISRASHAAQATTLAPPEKWSEKAINDIVRAHLIISEAHPAVPDLSDVRFKIWFVRGYKSAIDLARRVESEDQALAALSFYVSGYEDSHLQISRSGRASSPPLWAGWFATYRGGRYTVAFRSPTWPVATPQVGDELVSCDGIDIDALLRRKVAPYVDRRMDLDATRAQLVVSVTSNYRPVWEKFQSEGCVVRTSAGELMHFPLKWLPNTEMQQAVQYTPPPISVENLGNSTYWIYATNFQPEQAEVRMLESVLEQVRALRSADIVVLDTRGNEGGDSTIGDSLLHALTGCTFRPEEKAYWRVSSLALRALKRHQSESLRLEGAQSSAYLSMTDLRQRMEAGIAEDLPFISQINDKPTLSASPCHSLFTGRLIVITDSNCVSACLTLVDNALKLPDSVHAGYTTNADTRYTDITQVDISDTVTLWLPLKVWKGRKRQDNEAIVPTIIYTENIYKTQALRAWLIKNVYSTSNSASSP